MENSSYFIMYFAFFLVFISLSIYLYKKKKQLDEMHGMMAGMSVGMLAGLITSTLYLLPTGDFLWGTILGSAVGLLFGFPLGRLGGHLGMMEGIIAGPMGGMMGAMLGQMVRPFNLEIFLPFFTFIFLITAFGLSYTVNCCSSCLESPKKNPPLSEMFILTWIITAGILLAFSIFLPFSLPDNNLNVSPASDKAVALDNPNQKEAAVQDGFQEIDLKVTSSAYLPSTIIAKKGLPLKIHVRAGEKVGCARELLFPDFGIDVILTPGENKTVEIYPAKTGTFPFRCSMGMIQGSLVVVD